MLRVRSNKKTRPNSQYKLHNIQHKKSRSDPKNNIKLFKVITLFSRADSIISPTKHCYGYE